VEPFSTWQGLFHHMNIADYQITNNR